MTLVVLAAGMGSRYGGLKQLDPITEHGEFIIDFSVYDALRAGYDKVVFIIKRENEALFRETIGRRIEKVIQVEYVFQEMSEEVKKCFPSDRVKPLGTAHALLCAREAIHGPFSVINADDFYGQSAYRLAASYLTDVENAGKKRFCMVGYELRKTLTENGSVSRGICQYDEDSFLTVITERTKIRKEGNDAAYLDGEEWTPLSGDSVASMNFFGFGEDFFSDLEAHFADYLADGTKDPMKSECYLPSAVSRALHEGNATVKILNSGDSWFGVTYPEDKALVTESIADLVKQGVYPNGLWK